MKLKFDTKGIRFRVWGYFIIFTAIVVLLIWLLHTYLLDNYYQDMKIRQTNTSAFEMIKSYKAGNIEDFLDSAHELTDGSDVYVQVNRGNTIVFPSTENTLYPLEIANAKEKLDAEQKKKGSKAFTEILTKGTTTKKNYIFATYLENSEEKSISFYLVTPLYPIGSTIAILKDMLILIIIFAVAFSLILSLYLSSRITKPIVTLTHSAKELSQGNYGITFSSDSHFREIENLANTLNRTSTKLEKAQNIQKDVLANVSHDLRTPLTMIRSYAEMIRDLSGNTPEKRNAHLKVIIDETDRLSQLVSDMMTLSTVQSQDLLLDKKPFRIKETILSILQPYALLEEQEGYHLQLHCRNDFLVLGDQERIKQVLSNLITNGIKYCGSNKQVNIFVRHRGKNIQIEVIDHGMGIAKEELPYIWERYYKSRTNHVRPTQGTGLGLSIVKEILTLHNAQFGVQSKVGKGTTFWFTLPVIQRLSSSKK